MKDGHVMVFATVSGPDEGAAIGKKVVEERLAACCNIIQGLRSIYRWQGKICDEPEALCVFKTRGELLDGLKKRLKELHSYEVPEIIAFEIKDGLPAYLAWIDEMTAAHRGA